MSIPIIVRVDGPVINDVVLVSEDMTLEALQESLYAVLKPQIPQVFFDEFGGDMGKMAKVFVEWTSSNQSFPAMTELTDSNLPAVLKLLQQRRGIDVLLASLPELPQSEEPAYEDEGY